MADYAPITCADYDVLELVCTYGYKIDLALDVDHIVGTAVTLQTDPPGEYLIVRLESDEMSRIRIDRIQSIFVLTRPACFLSHTFVSTQA